MVMAFVAVAQALLKRDFTFRGNWIRGGSETRAATKGGGTA
jgi:hypothetical protein